MNKNLYRLSLSRHCNGTIASGALLLALGGLVPMAQAFDVIGDVTVYGDGTGTQPSPWNINSGLTIGNIIPGSLTIANGGKVISSGSGIIGYANADGTVTVKGSESSWLMGNSGQTLTVGANGGNGMLTISDGARVSTGSSAFFGWGGTTGTVTVTTGGSLAINGGGQTIVGGSIGPGASFLTIEDGGTVTSTGSVEVALSPGSKGIVLVDGDGSSWTIGDFVYFGERGNSAVTISNGGRVSADGNIYVSMYNGSEGIVTVTGSETRLESDASLYISYWGGTKGLVTVGDGGTVSASNGEIILAARDVNASGIVNIGAATGDTPIAPGTLITNAVRWGEGEGQLVFNHTSLDYTFDATINSGANNPPGSGKGLVGSGQIEVLAGRTIFNADHGDLSGTMRIQNAGILQINGNISSADVSVFAGGTLEGHGIVGNLSNSGTVVPGIPSMGMLTVNSNYWGNDGLLVLNTVLGDDTSATDMLVVMGDTGGTSFVKVNNAGGTGGLTTTGIEIITVGGASDGVFTLVGDEVYEGEPVVIAGAYAYGLYKGNASGADISDWYLRSVKKEEGNGGGEYSGDGEPVLTPSAQTYEAYPSVLLGLNGVSTLQQRVGNRFWKGKGNHLITQGANMAGSAYVDPAEAGAAIETNGAWGRIEGMHTHIDPDYSTSGADYKQNYLKLQAGIDGLLHETENGKLIGGLFGQYIHSKARISSHESTGWGNGKISTDGYGLGGTLTWYGESGFYFDAQVHMTWYRSNLASGYSTTIFEDGNKGSGYVLSVESGKRIAIDPQWSVTPQAQLVYSRITFDDFQDVYGAPVSLERAASLQGRLGITLDHENSWQNTNGMLGRAHAYGIANLYYEFLANPRVNVADVIFANRKDRLWGGIGLGGSHNWNDDKYSIYGEVLFNTSLNNFADSYSLKGNVGFRVRW